MGMENQDYSVLMTVYSGETADNFEAAVKSIMEQTVQTNDFVIMCDGELTPELDAVLDKYKELYGDIINVVRCPKRDIWADVLNDGLKHCKNELVARMDSDDISVPNRCETLLNIIEENPSIDVISSTLGEFYENPNNIISKRELPTRNDNLEHFAKYRCPLNHGTVMYKKSAVLDVGGYEYFPGYEDYQLWIRMMDANKVLENTPEVLYLMRAGDDLYRRRGGKQYFHNMVKFKKWMRNQKWLSAMEYYWLVMANGFIVLMPSSFRKLIYSSMLRK